MFRPSIRGSAAVVYIDIVAYYGQNVKPAKPHPRPLSKDMERGVRRRPRVLPFAPAALPPLGRKMRVAPTLAMSIYAGEPGEGNQIRNPTLN